MSYAEEIGQCSARKKGQAMCGDAAELAASLREGDLAFIDPPYSAVHYSRFYHVLETIARGSSFLAEGEGRYPPISERPLSDFSVKTKSRHAFKRLFAALSKTGARAIVTFPADKSSNGLSGHDVHNIAEEFFKIEKETVSSRFSTLGGNLKNRVARQNSKELIMTLSPK